MMIKELFSQVSMTDSIPPLRNKEFKIIKNICREKSKKYNKCPNKNKISLPSNICSMLRELRMLKEEMLYILICNIDLCSLTKQFRLWECLLLPMDSI
jgi:hypothetical protein